MHVCLRSSTIEGGKAFSGGYSFMLSVDNELVWDKEKVMNVLREQEFFYTKHTLSIEIQN